MTYRVLITGMTAQQVGHGTMLKYGPVIDLFRDALVDAGCTVEHRSVDPGESLADFDCAIVGHLALKALGATYCYNALDVIRRAWPEKCGLIFMVDDWRLSGLYSSIRTLPDKPHNFVKPLLKSCRKDYDWALAHQDELMQVVVALRDRQWPITLVPKFSWGDATKLVSPINSREVISVDPSSYAVEYSTVLPDPSTRYAQWTLGILSDQREWVEKQKLSWPVDYIGSKRSKAERSLKEPELVQRYAQSWGVLSPMYSNLAGTGWWRNRFVYAARTNSILLGSPREVQDIGDAYLVSSTEIEAMNVPQLVELARAQREQLESKQWPKEQVQQTLLDAVRRAVEEVP